MMNQGPRPTFHDGRRVLEAHIFGFEGNLYDEWVRIEWIERLRDIEPFDSIDLLRQQLERDRTQAQAVLHRAGVNLNRVSHA